MKKRVLCIFLALSLTFALTGCDNLLGKKKESGETSTQDTEEKEEEVPEENAADGASIDEALIPILPEISEEEPELDDIEETKDRMLTVVYFGDSQFENGSADKMDIPHFVGEYTHSRVLNLGLGGSCAALTINDSSRFDAWDNFSFYGMVHILSGDISTDILEGRHQKTVMEAIDPAEVDYYVISYGLNDFLNGIRPHISGSNSDMHNYYGALSLGINKLKDISPQAQIIVCTPAYTQFFNQAGVYLGDSHTHDYGIGVFDQYAQQVEHLCSGKYLMLDAAFDTMFNLNPENADKYLIDGVHLNERGRNVYALALSYIIAKDQGWTDRELERIDIDMLEPSIGFLEDIPLPED